MSCKMQHESLSVTSSKFVSAWIQKETYVIEAYNYLNFEKGFCHHRSSQITVTTGIKQSLVLWVIELNDSNVLINSIQYICFTIVIKRIAKFPSSIVSHIVMIMKVCLGVGRCGMNIFSEVLSLIDFVLVYNDITHLTNDKCYTDDDWSRWKYIRSRPPPASSSLIWDTFPTGKMKDTIRASAFASSRFHTRLQCSRGK